MVANVLRGALRFDVASGRPPSTRRDWSDEAEGQPSFNWGHSKLEGITETLRV